MRNTSIAGAIVRCLVLIVALAAVVHTLYKDPKSIQKTWDSLPAAIPQQEVSVPKKASVKPKVANSSVNRTTR